MTTAEGVSDAVARNLQQIRRQRDVSAADLADACADLGYPQLTAAVIANIETGRRDQQGRRRRAVTVDEVYALAQALGVGVTILLPPPQGRTEAEWQSRDRMDELRTDLEQRSAELTRQAEGFLSQLDLDPELEQKYREELQGPGRAKLAQILEAAIQASRADPDQIHRAADELFRYMKDEWTPRGADG